MSRLDSTEPAERRIRLARRLETEAEAEARGSTAGLAASQSSSSSTSSCPSYVGRRCLTCEMIGSLSQSSSLHSRNKPPPLNLDALPSRSLLVLIANPSNALSSDCLIERLPSSVENRVNQLDGRRGSLTHSFPAARTRQRCGWHAIGAGRRPPSAGDDARKPMRHRITFRSLLCHLCSRRASRETHDDAQCATTTVESIHCN